jgi:hypothetical protein
MARNRNRRSWKNYIINKNVQIRITVVNLVYMQSELGSERHWVGPDPRPPRETVKSVTCHGKCSGTLCCILHIFRWNKAAIFVTL